MRRERWTGTVAAVVICAAWTYVEGRALADGAHVSVGDPSELHRERWARPPARPLVAVDPVRHDRDVPPDEPEPEPAPLYRAPFRLHVGPMAATTGRGLGLGLGVAADIGRGTVGARLTGAWMRGESSPAVGPAEPTRAAPLGSGLSHYTGELTIDLHKRGPIHPVFGVGFGLAHVARPAGSIHVGIGVARLGLEYALALEDADVRLGAGVTGVLTGPSERDADALRSYALVGATCGIGF